MSQYPYQYPDNWPAAAVEELRLLKEENERLRGIVPEFLEAINDKLCEVNDILRAQRDLLLDFAKYVVALDPENPAPLFEKARTAVEAAEGEKQ